MTTPNHSHLPRPNHNLSLHQRPPPRRTRRDPQRLTHSYEMSTDSTVHNLIHTLPAYPYMAPECKRPTGHSTPRRTRVSPQWSLYQTPFAEISRGYRTRRMTNEALKINLRVSKALRNTGVGKPFTGQFGDSHKFQLTSTIES